jgi:hypothetical protein
MTGFYTVTLPFRNSGLAGQLGISVQRLFTGHVILGTLGLISGYLILRGNTWGWWIGSVFYGFAALRNIDEICIFTSSAGVTPTIFMTVLISETVLMIGALAALAYMFSEDVRGYLAMLGVVKRRLVISISGIVLGLMVLLRLTDLLLVGLSK